MVGEMKSWKDGKNDRKLEGWKVGRNMFSLIMFGMMDGKLKGCAFLCLVLDGKLDRKEKYIC